VELCNRDLDELVEVHARDELGSTTRTRLAPGQQRLRRRSAARSGPRPLPRPAGPAEGSARIAEIVLVTLLGLAGAGVLRAVASGTPWPRPTVRVVLGGAAAMAVTALVGQLAGVAGI